MVDAVALGLPLHFACSYGGAIVGRVLSAHLPSAAGYVIRSRGMSVVSDACTAKELLLGGERVQTTQ